MSMLKRLLRSVYQLTIRLIKSVYWFSLNLGYKTGFFKVKGIPIIINNFNRLTYPVQLISFLEKCGYKNIILLDNNSTYPPLLAYYKECPYKVIRYDQNFGHLALWKSGLYQKYKWNYFVYTDSDVVPINECPKDFLLKFKKTLDRFFALDKIGFGIKIDDLPSYFELKDKVVKYEQAHWAKEIEPGLFDAKLDTTFSLYKPFSDLIFGEASTLRCFRFGPPYILRHLPWYVDGEKLSDEDKYYIKTSNESSSLSQQMKGLKNIY